MAKEDKRGAKAVVVPLPIAKRKRVDTISLGNVIDGFKLPPFQREIKVNAKLLAVADEIRQTGVFPGILTIGVLKGDMYVVDGQHRLHARRLSQREDVLADVHYIEFDSMAEMADEYVRLNSAIVRFGPDDILKGMEKSMPALAYVREQCTFVGYGQIRRNEFCPIVSMSRVIRCWAGSSTEVPNGGHGSAAWLAEGLTKESAEELVRFLKVAETAWGREAMYARLWGALNTVLCMWLYRRTVLLQSTIKKAKLTEEMFRKGMMALSASDDYMDWLVGRNINDRDRAPAYDRIKKIIVARMFKETGEKIMLPAPPWESRSGKR